MNVLYAKAVFFQTRKDWNSALKAYSDLHKISPFHADSHYNIGFIHMELDLFNIATNNFFIRFPLLLKLILYKIA